MGRRELRQRSTAFIETCLRLASEGRSIEYIAKAQLVSEEVVAEVLALNSPSSSTGEHDA
jgi:predicted transposase YdaD